MLSTVNSLCCCGWGREVSSSAGLAGMGIKKEKRRVKLSVTQQVRFYHRYTGLLIYTELPSREEDQFVRLTGKGKF